MQGTNKSIVATIRAASRQSKETARGRIPYYFALIAALLIGAALGCGGDGARRGDVAMAVGADSVRVTYYYLPG